MQSCTASIVPLARYTREFQSDCLQWSRVWNLWSQPETRPCRTASLKREHGHQEKGATWVLRSKGGLRHPGHVEAAAAWWSAEVRSVSFLSLSLSFCWVEAGDDERKLLCMVSLTSIPLFFFSFSFCPCPLISSPSSEWEEPRGEGPACS